MTALDKFLHKTPAAQHELIRALDALIMQAAPTLLTSSKWGNLTYHGKTNVCAIVAHSAHLNLQLWGGTGLNDPRGALAGTGKTMRHLKFAALADVDREYVADLVQQAARLAGQS